MLDFKIINDKKNQWIETSLTGKLLLNIPQLNKGTAFSEEERKNFGLLGKLPAQVETLEEQVKRTYLQFKAYENNPLQQNIYLNNLHDKNSVLFYKLVSQNLAEMFPVIYTPIVGTAVKKYSREFRQARGLYIAYKYRDRIAEILDNRSHPEIDLIVVTDGERILGIGDQGIGGMDIPIAKLMVYTLCAGINPLRTLPILLDVGTNNQELLADPLYLGLRHPRITGKDYDDFIDDFVTIIKNKFPNVFLHWEDFGRQNATRFLEKYRTHTCSFNDDVQGTAVVTLSALLAAVKTNHSELKDQKIIIFGAGTAGIGVAEQIMAALKKTGLSEVEARSRFWLIDQAGLLTTNSSHLTAGQKPFARDVTEIQNWHVESRENITLYETIKNLHPTILLGFSAQKGAFTEAVVKEMAKHCKRPIIFPLSNPNEYAEATPENLLKWTEGQAMIATGSPFPDVNFKGRNYIITQCNNAFAFPGIGLGIIATKAKRLTDEMLWVACETLSQFAPCLREPFAPLLPPITQAREVAKAIALQVAAQAQIENLMTNTNGVSLVTLIDQIIWQPTYLPLKYKSQCD